MKKTYTPKLNPILYNLAQSRTKGDKRSDHPDFATTSELKAKEWSGVRKNSITDTYEFWVAGEIKKQIAAAVVAADYMTLERAHVELFGLHTG